MNIIFAIIYVFGCLIAWFLLMYLEYRTFKKLIPEDVVVDFLLSVFSWVSAFVAIFLIFVQFVINLNVKFDFLTNFANLITRIFNKLENKNKLDMILIKTNLKQIPKKCTKCKFSGLKGAYSNNYNDFFSSNLKTIRYCKITNKEVPYVFNKEKNNWEYTKCKNCPLIDSERTMEI